MARRRTAATVPGHVDETTRRGGVKRRPTFVVTGFHVGAVLHEKPHHRQVVVDARLHTSASHVSHM